jgi:hypothetical protein
LGRSYPESAASFAAKFAEGAIGKSGRKISVKGLQAKWARVSYISKDPKFELRDTKKRSLQ